MKIEKCSYLTVNTKEWLKAQKCNFTKDYIMRGERAPAGPPCYGDELLHERVRNDWERWMPRSGRVSFWVTRFNTLGRVIPQEAATLPLIAPGARPCGSGELAVISASPESNGFGLPAVLPPMKVTLWVISTGHGSLILCWLGGFSSFVV